MARINYLVHMIAIMFLMYTRDIDILGHISETYSGPVTKIKNKNNFVSGKVSYQAPEVKKQRFYHNKSIPLGCRESRKSFYGKEVRANAKRDRIRKSLENKL